MKTVSFDSRAALVEALRAIKASGGDLSQVMVYTATSPPKAVMAAEVYDTWARSRAVASTAPRSQPTPEPEPEPEPESEPAPMPRKAAKKTTRRRKSTTRGNTDG